MGQTLSHKIIRNHLLSGETTAGASIGLRMDQTLTQDATGTMACLQWEAIGLDTVQTELSVNYVDHNTIQMGFRNPDDHRYLKSVAAKYGMIFSPPGTGICHQLHLENFARPGKTLIGSDSHTPTAGGVGSLAIGAGGLSVALAMAGQPYTLPMPRIIGVYLQNELTGWASAKDVILALLAQLSVKGGVGAILEYTGPGVASLSVPERATITNMGAELGATSSLFPSDERTREFLRAMHRETDFIPLTADTDAEYDEQISLDLAQIEPLAACPHMPDNVVAVAELDGLRVDQVAIGSCTNSSYSDLKMAAQLLQQRHHHPDTDLLLAPGSKQVLKMLDQEGLLETFIDSGGRLLECACGPCIGMGGSPSSGGVSVRTFNRNFEGRSGTQDGHVYLTSPIVAAKAALDGRFTDPATWGPAPAKPELPREVPDIKHLFIYPPQDRTAVEVQRGPNIIPLPPFDPLPQELDLPVVLKVGDNITTDHILPGGPQVTALRSNIPAISEYIYSRVDPDFITRAKDAGQGIILGGENYGQGSSREHAALAPRYLGIRVVLAKSFARIHRANLVNFGILPLTFTQAADYEPITQGMYLSLPLQELVPGHSLTVTTNSGKTFPVGNDLTHEELAVIRAGGKLNTVRHS
ncbi:MAG: aconitate hydratase [Desulfohalobium sp.]